jgi:hypothetical protein
VSPAEEIDYLVSSNCCGIAQTRPSALADDRELGDLAETENITALDGLTGRKIADHLQHLNDPSGTVVIGGPDGMAAALKLIQDGKPINYDGAGGPQDFDAVGNVKGDYVLYEVRNRQFVDVKRYNCIADPKCPEI